MITIDTVKKLDIRIGTITSAERVPDANRLLQFMVDVGEGRDRSIVSGIAEYINPEDMVGKQVPVVVNLEPRTIRGVESRGMILYVVGEDIVMTLEPGEKNIPPGTSVQ